MIPVRLTQLYRIYKDGELVGEYRGLTAICALHAACRDHSLSLTFDNLTVKLVPGK